MRERRIVIWDGIGLVGKRWRREENNELENYPFGAGVQYIQGLLCAEESAVVSAMI